jgi:acyl carrier protein
MNTHHRTTLRWLSARLAVALGVSTPTLDPLVPLADMGVDSVHALSLVGEIQAQFDIDVEPTLIFDYPTLSHIAKYISTAVAEQARQLDEAVA